MHIFPVIILSRDQTKLIIHYINIISKSKQNFMYSECKFYLSKMRWRKAMVLTDETFVLAYHVCKNKRVAEFVLEIYSKANL